jgi:hypothetical protein
MSDTDGLWEDLPLQWPGGDDLGFLPLIIASDWDLPAAEQIAQNYAHGGGYRPRPGFGLVAGKMGQALLQHAGDPDIRERSRLYLPYSDELCILFEHDFLAIVQDDGSFAVTRVD